ncbi:MAG: hypothetical protein JO013_06455 [Alphaproteobacteria bacterium]|nr:hypothetical protein [Alphaproteobacteria bacterium]
MKAFLILAGLVVAVVGFGSPYLSSVAAGWGASGFPKAGRYAVASERNGRSETSDTYVDASTRAKFEAMVAHDDGTRCRDRQVTIGAGAFSVSMTCDAYDGDIHNIGIERRGTYSERSFEMVSTTRLWGMPIVEKATYRLRETE